MFSLRVYLDGDIFGIEQAGLADLLTEATFLLFVETISATTGEDLFNDGNVIAKLAPALTA